MTRRAAPAALLVVLALGCAKPDITGAEDASTGGPVGCGTAPCGGDPTGTWEVVSVCRRDGTETCPATDFDASGVSVEGFFSFGRDGRYRYVVVEGDALAWTWPASCLDGFETCSELDLGSRSCTGVVSSGCTCTADVYGAHRSEGTWTVDGARLSLVPDEGDAVTFGLCVAGASMMVVDDPIRWIALR